MVKQVVTFLGSLIASFFTRNRRSSCMRKVAAALLAFQVISMGVAMVHMHTTVHVHSSRTGEVIHLSATLIQSPVDEQPSLRSEMPVSDEDVCELFNPWLRPSVAQHEPSVSIANEAVLISQEILARKLDRIYRATRLLLQAPKNSPPSSLS